MAKGTHKKLTDLEFKIMRVFWELGSSLIRDIREQFPIKGRPAYTTVQTVVYRLEEKKALSRKRKMGLAHLFEPAMTREQARSRLIEDTLDKLRCTALEMVETLIDGEYLKRSDLAAIQKSSGGLNSLSGSKTHRSSHRRPS